MIYFKGNGGISFWKTCKSQKLNFLTKGGKQEDTEATEGLGMEDIF